jgi:rubrerythrin
VAREQAARAEDPAARQALNRIADDEERHAALAWRYVRFAMETGGETVRRAVETAFRESVALARVAPAPSYEVRDLAAWHRHGRLTHDETLAVTRAALDDVIAPCAKSLLNSASPQAESAVA